MYELYSQQVSESLLVSRLYREMVMLPLLVSLRLEEYLMQMEELMVQVVQTLVELLQLLLPISQNLHNQTVILVV